jgi:hypothetical protein
MNIEHNNFGDWKLDLSIDARRLLVLDTKKDSEMPLITAAFIDGNATIIGQLTHFY